MHYTLDASVLRDVDLIDELAFLRAQNCRQGYCSDRVALASRLSRELETRTSRTSQFRPGQLRATYIQCFRHWQSLFHLTA
jgi:hypothetical protein